MKEQFESLYQELDDKRRILLAKGTRKRRWRRGLMFSSAVLALVSGGGMTALLTDVAGGIVLKVMTPLLAFASGLIGLIITHFYDDQEIQQLTQGAAEFMEARGEALQMLMDESNPDPKIGKEKLEALLKKYTRLSSKYGDLLDSGLKDRRRGHKHRQR